jgi:hypothetical protein
LKGLAFVVVLADVGHDTAGEILLGGEDVAVDEIAFDLREPEFDLIEPGGVGRSEVELDVGVQREEILDTLRRMR